jgi:hypothetical protein
MTELRSDVGRFVAARLDEDAAAAPEHSRRRTDDLGTRGIAEYFDRTGELLQLGTLAARWAYHPDYANWPAYPWAEYHNWPPLDPNGALS